MNDWLNTIHLLGLILWGGTLLGIVHRSGAGLSQQDASNMLHRGALPGAFLCFFTGVWLTHEDPQLLRQWVFHIKLGCIVGLMAMHTLCVHRFVRQTNTQNPRPIFFTTATLLAGCIVLTTLVSSNS